jgi:Animal haem peroxidase
VKRHGLRRFYIVGEGVYGEARSGSVDGKKLIAAKAADAAGGAPNATFRFSRIGPRGGAADQLGDARRQHLAELMTVGDKKFSRIPSGFTYLGQFIDHDLTMDTTGAPLGDNESPADMVQGRSPALDLDSLYGKGPNDPDSEVFYQADLLHLKTGGTDVDPNDGFDLPRAGATPSSAVIPDPRNDENLAVAQTHLAFIRFHNRVVDTLPSSTPAAVKFMRARKIVTRHYQWMIKTDFLPRICDPDVVTDVFKNGRKIFEAGVAPTQVPTMPIEFSVAAYRLGHSMVRQAYNWNVNFDNGDGTLELLFFFSGTSGSLGGNNPLPFIWVADFRRLYNFGQAGRKDLVVPAAKFNRAMRIDASLAHTLARLPQETIGPPKVAMKDPRHDLAFRNLTRAKMVSLATGQQMVAFLKSKGVNVKALTAAQIRQGSGDGVSLAGLSQADRDAVVAKTPLWFYILREAELNGGHLAGVGARIVAETFHRAMEGSQTSIVRDPTFKPTLGPNANTFRMVDLLLFAFQGKKKLLNPNGG